MKDDSPLDFLAKARTDRKLGDRVMAAVERGGRVTAEEILEIAHEFGYSFNRTTFERDVRQDMERRLAAGDTRLADVAGKKKPPRPPLSSCARGCLSYTKSWHPPDFPLPPLPT
jgi:hypothetical protein